jgi:trans-aconitate methyltransferase
MMHLPTDRALHRGWLVSLTEELKQGLVVDLGCGRGEDLTMLAARHSAPNVRFVGLDASADAIAAASAALAADTRVSLSCAALELRSVRRWPVR